MKPVIALVGRPNVGKSTLFNRLTRSRDAIVANFPGLTRDRQYGEGRLGSQNFIVIDTGGITGHEEGIDAEMAAQSLLAIEEASYCLLLVDAQHGLAPDDDKIVDHLRKSGKPLLCWLIKLMVWTPDQACVEFYSLGVEQLYPNTATQGRGVRQMLEAILGSCSTGEQDSDENSWHQDSCFRPPQCGQIHAGQSPAW